MLREWENLPEFMQIDEVRPYWESLNKKRTQLVIKRIFDFTAALILLFLFVVPMAVIALMVKCDSKGPVFYRQERVTAYGRRFRIHKFRTMVDNADSIGTTVTIDNDRRITRTGAKLRHLRLDELPQLLDVLGGNMSFVGTRPEAVKYVDQYKPEYFATLLLPAGITSEASIRFRDEERMLSNCNNVDQFYMEEILPCKMKWNLVSMTQFNLFQDAQTLLRTVAAVFGRSYI